MRYDTRYRPSGISPTGFLPPGVKWLLIINVALFLFDYLATTFGTHPPFLNIFGLVPGAVLKSFAIWQLVTYMFLHDRRGSATSCSIC